jgi:predicted nucleic acid-binding Zn ribbon protein
VSTCENCGKPLTKPAKGRPQTRFCSTPCKEAVHSAEKIAANLAARQGRICAECDGPIPVEVNLRAKTCSRECGVAYQNRRRQEGKRAAWMENKPPCGQCGGEIPESRPAGSLYCSPECKKKTHDAIWRAKSPMYMRTRAYGITAEWYAETLITQGNACAICRDTEPGGKGGWHVDHDHATGKVRGLLCHGCNIALGYLKDDITRLRAAIAYLEAHAS